MMDKHTTERFNPWYLLGLAGIILFGMGISGFARHAAWHNQTASFWDQLYLTLQLIPLNSGGLATPVPWELNVARFALPVLAATTAIKAFLELFREQLHMLRLRGLQRHIIICGLSRKGLLLAKQFRKAGGQVVVIERSPENDWLESCRQEGMFILVGDATDPALLRRAGIQRACGLFAVCDDDGTNAAIAVQSQVLIREQRDETFTCLAHIADPQLCALLRQVPAGHTGNQDEKFCLHLFNVFERGARQMLNQYPAWDGNEDLAAIPHLLVIGLGRMGENVVVHLARDWWNRDPAHRARLPITVLDRQATAKIAILQARYPRLNQACELRPLDIEVHSAEFEQAAFLEPVAPAGESPDQGTPRYRRIYICLDNDALGLHAALVLLRSLAESAAGPTPTIVRMTEESGLARLLNDRRTYPGLAAFGYLDKTCTPDLLQSTSRYILARAAHERYLEQSLPATAPTDEPVVSTGEPDAQSHAAGAEPRSADPALVPWEQLDEKLRRNNYQWVDHINDLLSEMGYSIIPMTDWDAPSFRLPPNQVEQMAQREHDTWCAEKKAEGWKYKPGRKDLRSKTNPALVRWEELSEADKEKNRAFVREIPEFLAKAGYQVRKNP